jgi:hypothetical protein
MTVARSDSVKGWRIFRRWRPIDGPHRGDPGTLRRLPLRLAILAPVLTRGTWLNGVLIMSKRVFSLLSHYLPFITYI